MYTLYIQYIYIYIQLRELDKNQDAGCKTGFHCCHREWPSGQTDTLLNTIWSWAPWVRRGGGSKPKGTAGQTDRHQQYSRHLEWTSYSKGSVTWVTTWAAVQSPLCHSEMSVCVTFTDTYVFYNTRQHVTSFSSLYNDVTLDIVIWFLLLIPQNIMLLT